MEVWLRCHGVGVLPGEDSRNQSSAGFKDKPWSWRGLGAAGPCGAAWGGLCFSHLCGLLCACRCSLALALALAPLMTAEVEQEASSRCGRQRPGPRWPPAPEELAGAGQSHRDLRASRAGQRRSCSHDLCWGLVSPSPLTAEFYFRWSPGRARRKSCFQPPRGLAAGKGCSRAPLAGGGRACAPLAARGRAGGPGWARGQPPLQGWRRAGHRQPRGLSREGCRCPGLGHPVILIPFWLPPAVSVREGPDSSGICISFWKRGGFSRTFPCGWHRTGKAAARGFPCPRNNLFTRKGKLSWHCVSGGCADCESGDSVPAPDPRPGPPQSRPASGEPTPRRPAGVRSPPSPSPTSWGRHVAPRHGPGLRPAPGGGLWAPSWGG